VRETLNAENGKDGKNGKNGKKRLTAPPLTARRPFLPF
jgi:hypothetical protein